MGISSTHSCSVLSSFTSASPRAVECFADMDFSSFSEGVIHKVSSYSQPFMLSFSSLSQWHFAAARRLLLPAAGIGSSVRFCRMSFAILPHSQIDALFEYLGPDFSNLRGACSLARERSNGVELYLEIIKWHCTNPNGLLKIIGFEPVGRLPSFRCARSILGCGPGPGSRQMWRFRKSFTGRHFLCCKCVVKYVRLAFSDDPLSISSLARISNADKNEFLRSVEVRSTEGRAKLDKVKRCIGVQHWSITRM